MPFRSWVIAVAFGLIAVSGQAQEQAQSPSGQTESQQSPSQALPLPLPVEIVEDQATADARERSEKESEQREVKDLVAQQGMNAATQAMNIATQRMADYALYSTILVGVGTVLLVVTLLLTWQANRAAVKAVNITWEIGKAQTKPYMRLAFRGGMLFDERYPDQHPYLDAELANTGHSSATDINIHIEGFFSDSGHHDGVRNRNFPRIYAEKIIPYAHPADPTHSMQFPISDFCLSPENIKALQGGAHIYIHMKASLSYTDVFKDSETIGPINFWGAASWEKPIVKCSLGLRP